MHLFLGQFHELSCFFPFHIVTMLPLILRTEPLSTQHLLRKDLLIQLMQNATESQTGLSFLLFNQGIFKPAMTSSIISITARSEVTVPPTHVQSQSSHRALPIASRTRFPVTIRLLSRSDCDHDNRVSPTETKEQIELWKPWVDIWRRSCPIPSLN